MSKNFGMFLSKSLNTSSSTRAYNDVYRKAGHIRNKLTLIELIYSSILDKGLTISYDDGNDLLELLSDSAENIYVVCEYIIKVINGPHSNVMKGLDLGVSYNKKRNKIKKAINESGRCDNVHKLVVDYILTLDSCYMVIHDIRSQETHMTLGNVEYREGILCYTNINTGTQNEFFKEDEITITIANLIDLINEFFIHLERLDTLLQRLIQIQK